MKAFGSKLFAKGGKRPTSASSSPAAAREAASQGEGSDSPLSPMRDDPSTEPTAGSPPPPMWANRKPPGGESSTEPAAGGPPPPMWANRKPPGGEPGGSSGPPPPMWGNKKPVGGGGGGGGPPPPMWGNKKPAGSTSGSGADTDAGPSSSMGMDCESSLSATPVVRHTP